MIFRFSYTEARFIANQEYIIRACSSWDKNYFISKFTTGLPNFMKNNENKWSLQKEALQGRQVTDALRVLLWHNGFLLFLLDSESSHSYQKKKK